MKLACLLTAAGSGSRYGEDKLRLMVNGTPMGIHALRVLSEVSLSFKVLVTSRDKGYLIEAAKEYGFSTVINPAPERGMSSSVRLGTEFIAHAGDYAGILYAVADQPHLKVDTVDRLISAFCQEPKCIWAPKAQGKRGNPVIFPAALLPELLQITGDRGGRQVIAAHPNLLRTILAEPRELMDIDFREDLPSC